MASQLTNIPVEVHLQEFCEACLELLAGPNSYGSILTDVLPSLGRVLRSCGRARLPLDSELREWKSKSSQVIRMAKLHCGDGSAGLVVSLDQVAQEATQAISALCRLGEISDVVLLSEEDGGQPVVVNEGTPVTTFEGPLREFCEAILNLLELGPGSSSVLPQTMPSLPRIFSACNSVALARLRAELNVSRTTSEQLMQFAGAHDGSAAAQLQARVQEAQDQADRVICSMELLAAASENRKQGDGFHQRGVRDSADSSTTDGDAPNAQTCYQLAVQSHQRQDLKTAETLYTEAVRLDESIRLAWLQRGRIRLLNGHASSAAADLTRALQLFADDPITVRWRGDAYSMCGRLEEALQDYDRSLEMMPESTVVRYNRAVVLRLMGRLDLAWSELTVILDGRSNLPGAYLNRGLICLARQQAPQAIVEFQAALVLQPGLQEAIDHLNELGVTTEEPLGHRDSPVVKPEPMADKPDRVVKTETAAPRPRRKARKTPLVSNAQLPVTISSESLPTPAEDELAVTLLSETSIELLSEAATDETPLPASSSDSIPLVVEPKQPAAGDTVNAADTAADIVAGRPVRTPNPSSPAGISIELRCPGCGGLNSIRTEKLQPGKAITCRRCVCHFSVQADGTLVQLVKNKRGGWSIYREPVEYWKDRRILGSVAAVLLLVGMLFLFRPANGDSVIAEDPSYPQELEPRAKMFTLAWLKGDFRTMRQLSDSVQHRELFLWAMDHPIPVLASPATLERDATFNVEIINANHPNARVHVRIDGLRIARGDPLQLISQEWRQDGDRWIFQPSGKNNL